MTSDRYFGMVIDFSKCGLAVRMQDFLPTGSEISITLGSRDGKLQEHFQKEGMASIRAKVRWSRKTTDGYLHGFSLAEIDEERGEKFVKIMRCALRGSVVRLDQTGTQG